MKKIIVLFLAIVSVLVINEKNFAQTSTVKMNEIQSRGVTTDPDWIELYNSSTAAVDISGYKIYDSGGNGGTIPKMPFPAGASVPAKGYYVIVTDLDKTTYPYAFGLSSSGEDVWLEDNTGAVIDNIKFGTTTDATQTYGRINNGTTWGVLTAITRAATNSPITMNEIQSRGVTTDPDWVEIYNASSASVDISGYKIYDSGANGGTIPKMPFPNGTTIPAKGFYVIVTDLDKTTYPYAFGLSSNGEDVWLEDAAGNGIDYIKFLATVDATQSYGKQPDGTGSWKILTTITKGVTNGTGTSVERLEVIPSGYGLDQNYPNPFNPSTMINYQLQAGGYTTLKVYDLLGREIATLVNGFQDAGSYRVNFNAGVKSNNQIISSGIYFYKLTSNNFSITKKMILSK